MTDPAGRRFPSPPAALLLFAAVLVSNVAMGLAFGRFKLNEDWLLVATPGMVLVWTAVFARRGRIDVRDTFLLRLPSLADLLMAFPLAVSFVVLSDQLSTLTQELYPLPQEFSESWLRLIQAKTPLEWLVKITTIGIAAAISEELLFRGFIQSALLGVMSRSAAVLWTSFLFMVLHLLPLPTFAAAGLVLGVTALATRSIVVPIFVHFVNNAAAIVLVNLSGLETLGDPVWIPSTILVPAVAIFALTMAFYLRRLLPAAASPVTREAGATSGSLFEERRGNAPSAGYPSLAEELSSVPPHRRRLGWLAVIAAGAVGMFVLSCLFFVSFYWSHPISMQAAVIETIQQECEKHLSSDAAGREGDLTAAFEALRTANESGNLEWRPLWKVFSSYAEGAADGTVDSNDANAILRAIEQALEGTSSPRRL